MQKPIWIFGGLAGILSALVEFLFYNSPPTDMAQSQSQVMYLIKIAIMVVCLIFGLILIKKLQGGVISIGRTIFSGVMISIIRASIMVIAFLVLYNPIGEFYEPHKTQALEQAEITIQKNDEIEEKEAAIKDAKETIDGLFKPGGYTLAAYGSSLATGIILSVLMAAFIAKNMMYQDE
ncbi:DUF4199 domain-containing protein [bacterium]|nr:DUF4199 domain-containing protein [bacterium]